MPGHRTCCAVHSILSIGLVLIYCCVQVQAGLLWPQPQSQSPSSHQLFIDPKGFSFRSKGYTSSILDAAYDRYAELMFSTPDYESQNPNTLSKRHKQHIIKHLDVYVYSFDQSLNLDTDESYTLTVEAPISVLQCHTVYGALRGLETLSQLIDPTLLTNPASPFPQRSSMLDVTINPWQASTQMFSSCWQSFLQLLGLSHSATSQALVSISDDNLTDSADAAKQVDSIKLADDDQHVDADDDQEALFVYDNSIDGVIGDTADLDVTLQHHKKKSKHHHKHKHSGGHNKHHKVKVQYVVNATAISDAPRFKHRGLLLDTARHFLPVQNIKDHLDAMSWTKLNVFHWHIVDDQSFPFESHHLPGLSAEGAFSSRHIYSKKDVAEIIMYAKDRGIRVIPEFDTPGHVASWGKAYPDLLTECYNDQGKPNGELGPMDPTKNSTYNTLWLLLREAAQVFPDSYLHLGGDEVPFDCWQSNPEVRQWMKANSFGALSELEGYFERRVLDLATLAGRSYIVWQDVLDNNVTLKPDTVVHVWKWWPTSTAAASNDAASASQPHLQSQQSAAVGISQQAGQQSSQQSGQQSGQQAGQQPDRLAHGPEGCQLSKGCPGDLSSYSAGEEPGWFPEMERVTAKGFRTLLSSPWYINLGRYAGSDWAEYYAVEPLSFKGSRRQHDLVIGGEACMWGEFVDATNSMSATWPRAAAVAERLWSDQSVRDRDDAERRLHEHRCRMLARGLSAQPLGPGFCPQDTDF